MLATTIKYLKKTCTFILCAHDFFLALMQACILQFWVCAFVRVINDLSEIIDESKHSVVAVIGPAQSPPRN